MSREVAIELTLFCCRWIGCWLLKRAGSSTFTYVGLSVLHCGLVWKTSFHPPMVSLTAYKESHQCCKKSFTPVVIELTSTSNTISKTLGRIHVHTVIYHSSLPHTDPQTHNPKHDQVILILLNNRDSTASTSPSTCRPLSTRAHLSPNLLENLIKSLTSPNHRQHRHHRIVRLALGGESRAGANVRVI